MQEVRVNRAFLEEGLHREDVTWYGIHTGFGALCNTRIGKDRLEELQHLRARFGESMVGRSKSQEGTHE